MTRDPIRKLGWEDRLIGAMRLAMDAGVKPLLLAEGANARAADGSGMLPLHHAALLAGGISNNDAAGLVQALATPGTIDHKAHENETPLLFAAWGGHYDVISALLGQGADPLGGTDKKGFGATTKINADDNPFAEFANGADICATEPNDDYADDL